MLVPSILRTLALLLLLGLALPAGAVEEETDELPDWMEAEADDAGFAIHEVGNYGADIPSPQEVVAEAHGARVMRANPPAAPSAAPEDAPDFEDFRHGLSPYGRWVQTPEYGLVWVPDASIQVAGWRPYLHGQWVWTRYGWTWVSDEPFGWATYHYGRWGFRVGLGWFWVPGYVWGPAWVVWRRGPDVIGWAPLHPGHVWVGVGYPVHVDHWVFVRHAHFHAHPIHRHWVHHHHHFHHTHWVRNWRSQGRVYAGPPRSWVERHAGRVHEVRIVRGARPAPSRVQVVDGSRRVEIYRPTPKAMVRPGSREATPVRVRTPLPADRVRPARGMRDERSGATPSVRVPKAQPGERVRPAESGSRPGPDRKVSSGMNPPAPGRAAPPRQAGEVVRPKAAPSNRAVVPRSGDGASRVTRSQAPSAARTGAAKSGATRQAPALRHAASSPAPGKLRAPAARTAAPARAAAKAASVRGTSASVRSSANIHRR